MEDEIFNICRTFSMENKNSSIAIETIKQNCRRIVKEKTGKKPLILTLLGSIDCNRFYNCICLNLVDNFFLFYQ